jgi:hypothetical protein
MAFYKGAQTSCGLNLTYVNFKAMANGFLLQQWQLLAGKVETCKLNFKEGC